MQDIPINELISLAGKRAIVTGGGRGIGLAISYRLAEAGASVLIADSDPESARAASRELKGHGFKAAFHVGDISQEGSVRDMVNTAVKDLGGIDILVNNAGIFPRIPLTETSDKDFEQVIAVNLKGTFLCSREASQRMIEQGRDGCIINIASIDAVHPSSKGLAAYDASKGGVLTLTKSMARELGQHDIRVNAIAPGGILTQGLAARLESESPQQGKAELKRFMARMVLGRMGKADEIARVALFLASDLASYVTGSLIVADGGFLIS